jgi:hypothetical protein
MDPVLTNACSPDWSSQDRVLALRGRKLLEFDPDGGSLVTIQMKTQIAHPVWFPDGSKIAFMCGPYVHVDICVMNADGADLMNLTASARVDWSPSWLTERFGCVAVRIAATGRRTTRLFVLLATTVAVVAVGPSASARLGSFHDPRDASRLDLPRRPSSSTRSRATTRGGSRRINVFICATAARSCCSSIPSAQGAGTTVCTCGTTLEVQGCSATD